MRHQQVEKFFESAAKIVTEGARGYSRQDVAQALNCSWDYYAGNVNASTLPAVVRKPLVALFNRFPGFTPVCEDKKGLISPKLGKVDIQDQQSGTTEMGEYPSRKLRNTVGESRKAVQYNVNRLTRHVENILRESAPKARGRYVLGFRTYVDEGKFTTRSPRRMKLVEAMADAEELLQIHGSSKVVLEATFYKDNKATHKQNIYLPAVKPRMVLEQNSQSLFRFKRTAERYARHITSEGKTCRLGKHSWGFVVEELGSQAQRAGFTGATETELDAHPEGEPGEVLEPDVMRRDVESGQEDWVTGRGPNAKRHSAMMPNQAWQQDVGRYGGESAAGTDAWPEGEYTHREFGGGPTPGMWSAKNDTIGTMLTDPEGDEMRRKDAPTGQYTRFSPLEPSDAEEDYAHSDDFAGIA